MPKEEYSFVNEFKATAMAHPNIAFIKYWGNEDDQLRLPANPSLSMNLGSLQTVTTVTFAKEGAGDELMINNRRITDPALARVSSQLDWVRAQAGLSWPARVESESNFPVGSGIASSAAAFAALSLAGAAAAGLKLDEAALSRLARRGSGSACRSVPGGFCQWLPGDDGTSFATSIAPAAHWELNDLVIVVNRRPSPGSNQLVTGGASSRSLVTLRSGPGGAAGA
jgi:diphosphomevalonate decarboxylase